MRAIVGNLDRFLDSVTPNPPSRYLHKSCVHDLNSLWEPISKDVVEYYTLGDLWNCYEEWSAYGVGTDVVLNNGDCVTQYYVPYLSAIQIYTNKFGSASRIPKQDNDEVEFESDSWSDDSTSDKLSRSPSNNSSRTWDATSEDSNSDQDASWQLKDKFGYRYLQYFEISCPYWRVPLKDKVTELSQHYPRLMTLRSVDLAPASWIAVAWYPIYHIPSQRNDKDLCACFLTFHTLSSCFLDSGVEHYNISGKETHYSKEVKEKEISAVKISLSPFGLATHKMQGDLWVKPDTLEHENMENLKSAASSWLKQLEIEHHDFKYFKLHTAV
ncbi:hypothetical protein SLEP1_g17416 [Rubroshorea leprosula]|uniref:Uncharacterized protein n=1 Tax=Rubroshorea leprosula TaxID=152421 RepID=A0AAV5J4T3_9ROSI|nr:hypothetical protein SLEP1_g17416 [Rubroshorea leprosula]